MKINEEARHKTLRVGVPGSEQPEGLAARSSVINITRHPRCVNGPSQIIWRAFFCLPQQKGGGKEFKFEILIRVASGNQAAVESCFEIDGI